MEINEEDSGNEIPNLDLSLADEETESESEVSPAEIPFTISPVTCYNCQSAKLFLLGISGEHFVLLCDFCHQLSFLEWKGVIPKTKSLSKERSYIS